MFELMQSVIRHHRIVVESWILFVSMPLSTLLLMDQLPELPNAPRWLLGGLIGIHLCFTLFITLHAAITMQHTLITPLSWLVVVTASMGYLPPYQEH